MIILSVVVLALAHWGATKGDSRACPLTVVRSTVTILA